MDGKSADLYSQANRLSSFPAWSLALEVTDGYILMVTRPLGTYEVAQNILSR